MTTKHQTTVCQLQVQVKQLLGGCYKFNALAAALQVVVWKSTHSGSVANRTRAEGLSFYYPAAVMPGSDTGSDGVEPASGFVIQNRQTLCSVWCPMYGARC